MGTIDTLLRIKADAKAAVAGLRPLETSLENIQETSQDAEKALKDLGDNVHIDVDDAEVDRVRREIERLRTQMRDDLRIDINADTRTAQRRIRTLQGTLRFLDTKDVNVDVDVDLPEASLIARAATVGAGMGTAAGSAFGATFTAAASLVGLAGVAVGAVGVGAGIASLKMLSLSDTMAKSKIAFTQFLGTSQKATQFLANLQKFAAKTPFEFPELVESSKTLLAFGVGSEDIIGLMTTLGDAAALTGAEVENLTDIWGQMEAKGKVSNEELLQLTENGIPAYKLLADAMGLSVPQVQKLAEKGKLLSDKTLPLLKQKMDETFGGGMAKQAETLGGKFSTLKDSLSQFGTEVGNALAPVADALIEDIQPALDDIAQWSKEHKGDMTVAITSGVAAGIDAFGSLVDAAATVVDAYASILDAVGSVSEAFGTFLVDVGTLVVAANAIPGIGRKIPDDLGKSLLAAGGNMQSFGQDTAAALHGSADGLRDFGKGIHDSADDVRGFGKKIAEGFQGQEIKAKIDRIQAHLDKLKKKPPSPKIDANIDAAEKRIKRLNGRLARFKKEKAEARLDVRIDKGEEKVKEIKDALAYLKKQKATPEIQADIKHWTKRLGIVKENLKELKGKKAEATVSPQIDKHDNAQAKDKLEETAKPGGKARPAPISPKVDDATFGIASGLLKSLTKTETKTIKVHLEENPTGDTLDPVVVSRLLGASQTTVNIANGSTASTSTQKAAQPPQVTSLAPRQTPVAVYLDGVEIAHRIEARRALAATTSVRRSA